MEKEASNNKVILLKLYKLKKTESLFEACCLAKESILNIAGELYRNKHFFILGCSFNLIFCRRIKCQLGSIFR